MRLGEVFCLKRYCVGGLVGFENECEGGLREDRPSVPWWVSSTVVSEVCVQAGFDLHVDSRFVPTADGASVLLEDLRHSSGDEGVNRRVGQYVTQPPDGEGRFPRGARPVQELPSELA